MVCLIFNKVFARSNIGYLFILSFITKIAALYFELSALSSLVDVTLIATIISVVVSNEQKINKLLKYHLVSLGISYVNLICNVSTLPQFAGKYTKTFSLDNNFSKEIL